MQKKFELSMVVKVACVVAIVLLIYIYANYDPVEWGRLFPFCPIHKLTGLSCPSCGNQRALHAILQGDFLSALRYNFFIIFTVLFLVVFVISKLCYKTDSGIHKLFNGKPGATIYLGGYFGWFVARNIFGL